MEYPRALFVVSNGIWLVLASQRAVAANGRDAHPWGGAPSSFQRPHRDPPPRGGNFTKKVAKPPPSMLKDLLWQMNAEQASKRLPIVMAKEPACHPLSRFLI